MTDDERFERDLAAVVREAAPDVAPVALRRRVDAAMSRPPTPSSARRWSPLFGAAAAAAVLLAVALIGPRLVQAPGQPPASGTARPSTFIGVATPSTLAAMPEPISEPGFVQIGGLITPTDAYVVNADAHVLLTHSSGTAWRDVTPSDLVTNQPSAFFFDPWHGWLSGFSENDQGGLHVWRTRDAGVTWTHDVVAGLREGNSEITFLSQTVGWLASDPGGDNPHPELRWSTDGGETWSDPIDLAAVAKTRNLETLTFVDQHLGFLSGDELFKRTTDGGRSWADIDIAPQVVPIDPDSPRYSFDRPTFSDPKNGVVQVSVSRCAQDSLGCPLLGHRDEPPDTTAVFATADGGRTWTLDLRDEQHRSWMFVDTRTWIAIDDTHVWTTHDAGKAVDVAASTGLPTPLFGGNGRFIDPLHGWVSAALDPCPGRTTVFCPAILPSLYATSDGGKTWAPVGAAAP